jgi:hypothetical protein
VKYQRLLGNRRTVRQGIVHTRTVTLPNGDVRDYRIEQAGEHFILYRGSKTRNPLGSFPCIEWAHAARKADMGQHS